MLNEDEHGRVEEILRATAEIRGKLNNWERSFLDDIEKQFDELGSQMRLSPKQWKSLEQINDKC